MRYVVDARYLELYRIWLKFEDDSERIVDLEGELTGEAFEPLCDLDVFRKVALNRALDTIVWESRADFAPEFFYAIGEPMQDSQKGLSGNARNP